MYTLAKMQNVKQLESTRNDTQVQVPVSVDCVVFGYDEEDLFILLRECDKEPFLGQDSLIGDFLRHDENLNQAAQRIIFERGGLKNLYLEQVRAFGKLDRHPVSRIVTVAYYAFVKLDECIKSKSEEKEAKWLRLKNVKELAFDHDDILNYCLDSMRQRFLVATVGFELLPSKFTLPQIQKLYETVLDQEFDKRNFRRKLMKMNVLKELNETQQGVSHRPAKLFSINDDDSDYDFRSLLK